MPRSDRLRLAPEFVAATADDYAQLVGSPSNTDWIMASYRRVLSTCYSSILPGRSQTLASSCTV
jgi:hypothetical protein